MTAPKKKPKHVSKTKQELRRLREFAAFFVAVKPGEDIQTARLRDMALYALTGKRTPAQSQRQDVKEAVRRLNKMSKEELGQFLAMPSEPIQSSEVRTEPSPAMLREQAAWLRRRGAR